MKKLLHNAVGPFAMFSLVLVFIGCEQASAPYAEQIEPEPKQLQQQDNSDSAQDLSRNAPVDVDPDEAARTPLKRGNMFYIVRDVADLQLKAGNYVEQLKNTHADLQTAISNKDQPQLQHTAEQLQEQLEQFNDSLNRLNLKSQEVDQIRDNILNINQQLLNSPLLNGQMNIKNLDFKKIEQQLGSVQNEMLKLAAMLMTTTPQATSEQMNAPET